MSEQDPKTLLPSSLRVAVGNLEITADAGAGRYMAGYHVKVRVNGEPLAVRKLTLRIAMGEVVSADVEFLPKAEDPPCTCPPDMRYGDHHVVGCKLGIHLAFTGQAASKQ